jgi:hypothetical protein
MFWVKRRVNQEFMEHYIWNSEQNYPMLCDDFGDEFDYADNVIEGAVQTATHKVSYGKKLVII